MPIGAWRGYSAEEIAGFPADVAQSLIAGDRAELHDQKKVGKAAGGKAKQGGKGGNQSGPDENSGTAGDQTAADSPVVTGGSDGAGDPDESSDDDPKP